MKKSARFLMALALLAFLSTLNLPLSTARAATITWINTAGGNWSDPNNWSPHMVPGLSNAPDSLDDVVITNAGTYTVVMDVGTMPNYWSIHTLTLGAGDGNGVQTLAVTKNILYVAPLTIMAGGLLTNNAATLHGSLTVKNGGQLNSYYGNYYDDPLLIADGGSVSAYGDDFHQNIEVASNGVFATSGVTVANDGILTVANSGMVNILLTSINLNGEMTNSGVVNIFNNGDIYVSNDGTTNYQGHLLNLASGTIYLNGDNGVQGNSGPGYFINQGAVVSTAVSAHIDVSRFDNSAGVVKDLAAGILYVGTFTNILSGSYYATNGSVIRFYGGAADAPLTAGSPLLLAGDGQYWFAGGWLELPADIISNLQLTGGQLKLDASFQGGTITNLALDGITLTNVNALPVTGTFVTTNSPLYGGYLVNSGGVWNANANLIYGTVSIAAGGTFNDYGIDHFYLPGSLTIAAGGQVNFINGYLDLNTALINSGIINLNGNNSIYIYNNGTTLAGGVINQAGGVINLLNIGGIGTTSYGHEYLINNGTIIKSNYTGNTAINVSDFTNSGAIICQEGILQLNKVTLQSSGSLGVRLNSNTDYGKFSIIGNAVLAGVFNATFNGGYVPAYGTRFDVLSYSSFSGNFHSFDLPLEIIWQPEYSDTVFTLVVGQPQFSLSLSGTNLIFDANGGTSDNQGILLSSPELTLPLAQWTPLATNIFDVNGHFNFTNKLNTNITRQFYILKYR